MSLSPCSQFLRVEPLPAAHKAFVDKKMLEAFGATLIQHDSGNSENVWIKYWKKIAGVRSKHYDVPGGAVGREFVDLLSEEDTLLCKGIETSEGPVQQTS